MSSRLPIVCASSQAIFMAKGLGGGEERGKKEGREGGREGGEGIKARSVEILREGQS